MKEYWIVDPLKKLVTVYDFEQDGFGEYRMSEVVKGNVFQELEIDFSGSIGDVKKSGYHVQVSFFIGNVPESGTQGGSGNRRRSEESCTGIQYARRIWEQAAIGRKLYRNPVRKEDLE